MGLAAERLGNAAQRVLVSGLKVAELGYQILDKKRPLHLPVTSVLDGEDSLVDEGPDDLWPPEEPTGESHNESSLVTVQQWGLRLPSGQIAWNMWSDTHLNNPLDRALMVVKLREAGLSCGYSEEQLPAFLGLYQWVVRTVFYGDTGVYPLTDPAVTALDAPSLGDAHHDGSNENSEPLSSEDLVDQVYPGSLGGDAP